MSKFIEKHLLIVYVKNNFVEWKLLLLGVSERDELSLLSPPMLERIENLEEAHMWCNFVGKMMFA